MDAGRNSGGCFSKSLVQEFSHCDGDLFYVGFEGKVPSVEKLDGGVRDVATESFGACGDEVSVTLAPDRE